MNTKEKKAEILKFWDERSKLGHAAGTNDLIAKQIEIDAIMNYVQDGMRVLDIGCGSGITAIAIAEKHNCEVVGFDFSEGMVQQSKSLAEKAVLKGNISFFVGDVLLIPDMTGFDIIYTERVLINLNDWQEQSEVISDIVNKLNPGGRYIMCENCDDGLNDINELRAKLNLSTIDSPWHNRYLKMEEVEQLSIPGVELEKVEHISSTYAFLSRVINAAVAENEGKEPEYDSFINQLALKLPVIGDLGQTKIWVWKKL